MLPVIINCMDLRVTFPHDILRPCAATSLAFLLSYIQPFLSGTAPDSEDQWRTLGGEGARLPPPLLARKTIFCSKTMVKNNAFRLKQCPASQYPTECPLLVKILLLLGVVSRRFFFSIAISICESKQLSRSFLIKKTRNQSSFPF